MTTKNSPHTGIAGIWDHESDLIAAATQVQKMGFRKYDVISPFPIHGMEEICGIKRSPIPYVTFAMGLLGLSFGLWFTWWTGSVSWPANVGGKPFFSLPAFVPILFELTILFAALSSVAALFYFCGMPRKNPPTIAPELTSHHFAIFISQQDTHYEEEKIKKLFSSLGAINIQKVEF